MPEAYCVKCKAKREMTGAKEVSMNGKGGKKRAAMTGTCEKCGTKMLIRIEPSNKDVINYQADCPFCHLGFSGVIFPNLPAPVIRLQDEDSSI